MVAGLLKVTIPSLGQSTDYLQNENPTRNTATTDLTPLLPADTDVVVDSKELGFDARGPGLLGRHTKVEDIASVVHRNDQDAMVSLHAVRGGLAYLLGGGGGENRPRHGSIEQTLAYETGESRFMSGTATGDDGDFFLGRCVGAAENDLVFSVKGEGGVCESECVQGSADQMVGVTEEVFR